MRPEYSFVGGERGKYAKRYAKGTNLVAIDPDVLEHFQDAGSINDVLRATIEMASKVRNAGSASQSKK